MPFSLLGPLKLVGRRASAQHPKAPGSIVPTQWPKYMDIGTPLRPKYISCSYMEPLGKTVLDVRPGRAKLQDDSEAGATATNLSRGLPELSFADPKGPKYPNVGYVTYGFYTRNRNRGVYGFYTRSLCIWVLGPLG